MIQDPSLSEAFHQHSINATSRASRVRGTFVRFGLLTSASTFFVVGGEVLLDQWAIGSASAVFMLGTELLIAGACIGLFGVIAAIGLAISALFENEPPIAVEPTDRELKLVE